MKEIIEILKENGWDNYLLESIEKIHNKGIKSIKTTQTHTKKINYTTELSSINITEENHSDFSTYLI